MQRVLQSPKILCDRKDSATEMHSYWWMGETFTTFHLQKRRSMVSSSGTHSCKLTVDTL